MTDPQTEGPGPATTPRTRARARHILDNYYIGPARRPDVLEIWGYTDKFTYSPGESIGFRVSTTAPRWEIEIGRDGAAYEKLYEARGLPGRHCETPEQCSAEGCGWPVAHEFTIPAGWKEGGYLVTLRARRGEDLVEEHHCFLLRRCKSRPAAKHLLVCATATWVAYNCWGGSNAYEGIAGPQADRFSPVLSTLRPWSRGFCKLPAGAPRAVPPTGPAAGEMVRYPYMEWAYSYGYSKKYASAGWASYERHFARWAERQGLDLDFAAQHDLETNPGLLARHACAVIVGHDEYWSAPMRDTMERFLDQGGRVARFAGNFFWQIRLEDQGRRQVCYKHLADTEDPLAGTERRHLATGAWETPPASRPGALTFGVNGMRGIYAGLGRCAGNGAGGFTLYRPRHWAFAGTGLGYGDVLGASARILGYEADGLDLILRDGLPFPTGADGADKDIEILAFSPACNIEADAGVWGETLYIADGDIGFVAQARSGAATPETMGQATRGNAVVISWRRGAGEVFCAASCEWVAGLARRDRQVEQTTRNVLERFAAGRNAG